MIIKVDIKLCLKKYSEEVDSTTLLLDNGVRDKCHLSTMAYVGGAPSGICMLRTKDCFHDKLARFMAIN